MRGSEVRAEVSVLMYVTEAKTKLTKHSAAEKVFISILTTAYREDEKEKKQNRPVKESNTGNVKYRNDVWS